MKKNNPVIFVVGATATGKSEWALNLAQHFDGVIVNCDSIQLYQKVDIGSAKPSSDELSKVPHYLFDYVAPPEEMTAGNYTRDFFSCMKALPEGRPVFVVGGTGFYFMAIEKGMYPVAKVSPEIHAQVEAEALLPDGGRVLYQELQEMDPVYAAKIHRSDLYRIGRAIELIRSQGKSMTQIQKEFEESRPEFPYPLLKIGPQWDREILKKRIRLRSEQMLQKGLFQEVRGLVEEGLENWSPMHSVGYQECVDVLGGKFSESQLLDEISLHTVQLAKKQRTWFQRDKDLRWFDGASGFPEARALVEDFLKT
jgi:tRNA dimethylallyltransferase